MNHSINFEGDWALHGIMSDLGVNYALSPFHRIGFEIDDAGIETLAERYHDRVFRARKWFDHDKLSWTTLLLRFDEGAFVVAHGDGTKDLIRLGVPVGEPIKLAHEFIQNFIAQGKDGALLEAEIFHIVANPPAFFADELRAPLARAIYRPAFTPRAELAPWRQWGEGLEAEAVKQMANACALPIAVAGALMPDAHLGYGLPIAGVLATDNAVIPYAVGVDIACRMKLTVYDRKANTIAGERDRLANIIADETRFGMGCEFKQRRQHEVMDEDWTVSPVTQRLHEKAWKQLGTSDAGATCAGGGWTASRLEGR